jgi:LAO/AO transport system kinase
VGVGQSETIVKGMTDFFLLLMLPGAGDELQGIKRGIMEMADVLAINKADGDNNKKAALAKSAYRNALHLLPPHKLGWVPKVVTCSALQNEGIDTIWKLINEYQLLLKKGSNFERIRMEQKENWMNETLQTRLLEDFLAHPALKKQLPSLRKQVMNGEIIPSTATRKLVALILPGTN